MCAHCANPPHLLNPTHLTFWPRLTNIEQNSSTFAHNLLFAFTPHTQSGRLDIFWEKKGSVLLFSDFKPTSSWTAATRPFSPPLASFPFLLVPPSLLPLRRLLVDTYCWQRGNSFQAGVLGCLGVLNSPLKKHLRFSINWRSCAVCSLLVPVDFWTALEMKESICSVQTLECKKLDLM